MLYSGVYSGTRKAQGEERGSLCRSIYGFRIGTQYPAGALKDD